MIDLNKITVDPPPERSEWTCYLSGDRNVSGSVIFVPVKGHEPNLFHRFMQELCFGVKWVRENGN